MTGPLLALALVTATPTPRPTVNWPLAAAGAAALGVAAYQVRHERGDTGVVTVTIGMAGLAALWAAVARKP